MAISHAKPGEVVDVRPLGSALASAQTKTLVRAEQVEVIRLVVPARWRQRTAASDLGSRCRTPHPSPPRSIH